MSLPPNDGPERRQTGRIPLHFYMEVEFISQTVQRTRIRLSVEIIDASQDGRGVALWVSREHSIPLGKNIALRRNGQPDIHGIVVSRLGTHARNRIGVRIDPHDQAAVRDLVARHSAAP